MRLDVFLVEKGYFATRTKAKQAIENNEIFIDGKLLNKPSFNIQENSLPDIKRVFNEEYVSIGGFKLSKALRDFQFSVKNFTCLDIGASTGGFTDCLLQNGAKKVYALDLNDKLLSDRLKNNKRITLICQNAKNISKSDFKEKIDFICADLSFISITSVLKKISNILEIGSYSIILIKPQFEMDKKLKFKKGIIKDEKLVQTSVEKVKSCALKNGLETIAITDAPLKKDKNHELLILFQKNG